MRVTPTKASYDVHAQDDDPQTNEEEHTLLIKMITKMYRKWATFVSKHTIIIIVLCTVATLIGTAKLVTTPNENDITGYTPYGARARDEFNVAGEFFSKNGNGIALLALVLPKHGKNALQPEILKEALRIESILTTNFTMLNKVKNKTENYREFCYSFCQINEPFAMFVEGYLLQQSLKDSGQPLNTRLILNYPTSSVYDREINIQQSFFGIVIEDEQRVSNQTTTTTAVAESRITNMESARLFALQLRAERKEGWTTQEVKDYEMEIANYFEKRFVSDHVRVLTLSTSYVESEVVRAGMSLMPFLIVGFVIMAFISSLSTLLSALYMNQVSIHKVSLAILACICPFMACGTGLGLLFAIGVRFGSILYVTPFLVLAIGVDDAYLMIHAWQRVTRKLRQNPHPDDSPAFRLAEVLADTGPAIIISALTNILADTVGTYTGSPEITLLAYGNMICIFVDFIYQITFYSAVMIIVGEFEMESERQQNFTQRICCGGEEVDSVSSGSETKPSFHDNVKAKMMSFLEFYLNLVTNKVFDLLVITLWGIGLGFTIYGITQMPINLTPKKLFAKDSTLLEMDDMRVDYVIPHYTLATIFINNPGNLSNPDRLQRLDNFVLEMESLPGAWGSVSSNYFIRDFIEFEKTIKELEADGEEMATDDNSTLNMNDIKAFIEWPEYEYWRGFLRTHVDNKTGTTVLDKFFLTTAFRGEYLKEWVKRAVMLRQWRAVVDKYSPEFNITVFSDDGIYLDLIDNMPTDTWQSAVATIGCMALICFIFMYDMFTVIVATGVITSIMAGILGILSWTGTELDPIVMAALIISIGFSVDIPAHVSYHYHTAGKHGRKTVRSRLHYCISSVGFPAIQASISTSLCVLSLLFVSIYMSQVFVKTMILCMALCVVHGLLLIPCLCSLLSLDTKVEKEQNNSSALQDMHPKTIDGMISSKH
ncbi:unnamed protein product [Auanema sp. JU1783]|nr:unnamed protein product [Auanema sp. JU1783]